MYSLIVHYKTLASEISYLSSMLLNCLVYEECWLVLYVILKYLMHYEKPLGHCLKQRSVSKNKV